VLAAEHLLDLAGLDFLVERVESLDELAVDVFAGLRPFDKDREVVALLPERQDEIAILLEAPPALQDLLCFCLVFPEIVGGRAGVQLRQLFFGSGRLKDSSADRRLAW
jgi:hypothetical protein